MSAEALVEAELIEIGSPDETVIALPCGSFPTESFVDTYVSPLMTCFVHDRVLGDFATDPLCMVWL